MNIDKLKGHVPDTVIAQIPGVLDKFEINTPLRLAHFLAQCGHESGGFKVVTENSPTVHEVSVKIPSFDKPVALRQEMRLINEGGKERIIVNNYFEEPLNEDLSILAAEMLRKKSVLEVNSNDSPTVSLTKTDPPG